VTPLSTLPVLVLDAQATSADPARGALVEVGWAACSAAEGRELTAAGATALVVAPPPGATMPPAVARITGLSAADWGRGVAPALVWDRLRAAAEGVALPTELRGLATEAASIELRLGPQARLSRRRLRRVLRWV
jgi:hypothetical protein